MLNQVIERQNKIRKANRLQNFSYLGRINCYVDRVNYFGEKTHEVWKNFQKYSNLFICNSKQVKIPLLRKMQAFQLFGQSISILECLGFVTGVIGVWLTIKQNILCFPIGIVNVAIYAFIFFDPKSTLYLNALLQLVYIIVLIYGWKKWKSKTASDELAITRTEKRSGFVLLFMGLAASVLLGYITKEHTDARLPYWDAITTSMSLIAQWMVAKKKIENWLLWIIADIIYVGMNIYLSLYLTAILYFIYFVLAIKGYMEWKKDMKKTSGTLR